MRHVAIVPARNEARYIARMLRSLLTQSEPPDRIVVVDDDSTDNTPAIVSEFRASAPSVELLCQRVRSEEVMGPAVVRAFARGYATVGAMECEYISKFDADLEFPPEYCERVLRMLDQLPEVGGAAGTLVDVRKGRDIPFRTPPGHLVGALKTYRRRAFDAIGGFMEVPGWDILDQVKLRQLGWRTQTLRDLEVRHLRPHSVRYGDLLGKAYWGRGAWVIGSHPLFVAARGFYRMLEPPFVIGGLAFWGGYLAAAARRVPQIRDSGLRQALRHEQLHRLLHGNRVAI